MQLLGFNCIRIPFSFTDLVALAPQNYRQACNATSETAIRASLTPPGRSFSRPLPKQVPACLLRSAAGKRQQDCRRK